MPNWLEKHVSKRLAAAGIDEAWVTGVEEIRQRGDGSPCAVVLQVQPRDFGMAARVVVAVPGAKA